MPTLLSAYKPALLPGLPEQRLAHEQPFASPIPPFTSLLVAYSIGPWLGIVLAGYVLGPGFRLLLAQRARRLRWVGAGALGLFVLLRPTGRRATKLAYSGPTWFGPRLVGYSTGRAAGTSAFGASTPTGGYRIYE